MSQVTVAQALNNITPADAWALFGDPAGISGWHPAIAQSPVEGDRRTIVLADGGQLTEQIVSHDDHTMRYRYTVVEGPLPVKDYVGTVEVVARGDGAEVRWSSEFEPLGPADEIEQMFRGLYAAGLEAARDQLGG